MPMKVKVFVFNPFQENTYVISDENHNAAIVDAGCYNATEVALIKRFVDDNELKVKYFVNTHCHVDHLLGLNLLKSIYNVEAYAHSDDLPLLKTFPQQAMSFGFSVDKTPEIDKIVADGNTLLLGDGSIGIIHTPGHTPGSICLYLQNEKMLLTGDTLFYRSIGRTDLPGGSYDAIIRSITIKLMVLPDDVAVYPGHGESTTIGDERRSNPFIKT